MRLVVDGHRLAQARTGVGRYVERLLWHWSRMDLPFDEVVCVTPREVDPVDLGPGPVRLEVAGPALPGLAWENGPLRRAARRADLFFGASYGAPLWCPAPTVVSNLGIYDSQPGTFPTWHNIRYTGVYRHSARRARLVIANSGSTRDDIARYYGVDPTGIRVVYPGVDEVFGPAEDGPELRRRVADIVGHDEPFFLMVGKLSVRRHVPELLEAFARQNGNGGPPQRLVIVGPNHLDLPLEEFIRRAGVEERTTYIPHLPQTDLRWLYAAATAFVLATTHEGFSFTILEAIACGAPVITIDHPPLREGVAQACHVLPAPEVDLLADAMAEVAASPELRADLRRRGLETAARFSWRRAAEETMAVLAEAAELVPVA